MTKYSRVWAICAVLFCAAAMTARAADWPVFGHDPARSGVDVGDKKLAVQNVKRLRERWKISFGTVADSTPIYIQKVDVRGVTRAMLFQTDKNGVTYGIDAASGHVFWRFTTKGVGNITTSTPAADPSDRFIYAPGVDGYVHKLDAGTGRSIRGGGFPAMITTMTQSEKNASSLNVANGYLYATTSGYIGDAPPYVGHVVAIRLSDGASHVFNSLCSNDRKLPTASSCASQRSGIWARGGAVVDPDSSMKGEVYAATGNGDFDANTGGHNYGDSVLGLTADLGALEGSYTPHDYTSLQDDDTDLGSTSPVLLPRQAGSKTPLLLAQGGKDAIFRLVNRAHLPGVAGELQELNLQGPLFSTPAVWTDSSNRAWIFIGLSQELDAYRVETSGGKTHLVAAWQSQAGQTQGEGTSPVVSNGIVFAAFDGAIVAVDALTGRSLWSSALKAAGGTIGSVHWQSPIVIDGWVYCSDQNGNLTAYALPNASR